MRNDDGEHILWHGSEPLAAGTDRLNALLKQFDSLRRAGQIQHIIQTGATLITDEWCSLFQGYDAGVRISIDGARFTNTHRVKRAEHAMFDQIVAGVNTLRCNGLPFTVLTVITQDTIEHATEILNFVHDELGCSWVGLNIEAQEAANVNGTATRCSFHRSCWEFTTHTTMTSLPGTCSMIRCRRSFSAPHRYGMSRNSRSG
ncbi:MAG: hypothetical protein ACRDTC_22135 [Pseudonocardiaceae bacterium]